MLMKTLTSNLFCIVALIVLSSSNVFADTRIPISVQTNIATPGSYVLTNDIVATGYYGLRISASDVTIDFNGYTLSYGGVQSFVDGIGIDPSVNNIQIFNGTVKSFTRHGIFLPGQSVKSSNLTIKNMRVLENRFHGISVESNTGYVIESSVVSKNQAIGIYANGGGLLLNNLISDNKYGLVSYSGGALGFRSNIFSNNSVNNSGTATNLGNNLCGVTVCP
jgi:Periplasmic copper-binding protein (NosD)